MTKVKLIEGQIKELSSKELAEFRRWFAEFDAEAWERQIEADVKADKLDQFAEEALREHLSGQTSKL